MIRSVNRLIFRQFGFNRHRNLAEITSSQLLSIHTSAGLLSEDPVEFKQLISQYNEQFSGVMFPSAACTVLHGLSLKAPKEASTILEKVYNEDFDKGVPEENFMFKLVQGLEQKNVDKLDAVILVSDLNFCRSVIVIFVFYIYLQVSAIKSALLLGIPPSSHLVQNLQSALTWQCRMTSIVQLNKVLSLAVKHKNDSEIAEKLFEEVIRSFELRWVEIDDPRIAASLIYYSDFFKEIFLARIEDKMINKAENLTTEEITVVSLKDGKRIYCHKRP